VWLGCIRGAWLKAAIQSDSADEVQAPQDAPPLLVSPHEVNFVGTIRSVNFEKVEKDAIGSVIAFVQ